MYSVMRSQNALSNVVSLYGSTHSAIRYNSKKSRQIVFAERLGAGRVPVQVTSTGERPEQLVPPPCRRGSVCRRRQTDPRRQGGGTSCSGRSPVLVTCTGTRPAPKRSA